MRSVRTGSACLIHPGVRGTVPGTREGLRVERGKKEKRKEGRMKEREEDSLKYNQ